MSKERYEWIFENEENEIIDNMTGQYVTVRSPGLLNEKDRKIADLEAKLAESENSLKCTIDHYEKYCAELNSQNIMLYASAFNRNQDKISFAVEQLTQAKDYIKKSLENMWNTNAEMTCRDRSIIDGIYNKIDSQITDLKGNEDE